MKWPFSKTEKREVDFSDAVVQALLSRTAGSGPIVPSATGAFEAGAGLISRAFASASIESDTPVLTEPLTPEFLNMLARALVRRGEFVAYIEIIRGRLLLSPAASWDVTGSHDASDWKYRVHLGGPSGQRSLKNVSADSVVHVRYTSDPAQPWRGLSPLENAALAGRLSSETLAALGDESSGSRGYLLPLPAPGDDDTVANLKTDIRNLKGQIALVEGQERMAAGTGGSSREWMPVRIGPAPPDALVKLHEIATREVLAALGVPPILLSGNPQGTAIRESWRLLLYATIAPMGRIVATELSKKLDADIRLGWDELRASDISGRARAFQSMTTAGMDVEKAAALSGLMISD